MVVYSIYEVVLIDESDTHCVRANALMRRGE